jgi:hypothetical protein
MGDLGTPHALGVTSASARRAAPASAAAASPGGSANAIPNATINATTNATPNAAPTAGDAPDAQLDWGAYVWAHSAPVHLISALSVPLWLLGGGLGFVAYYEKYHLVMPGSEMARSLYNVNPIKVDAAGKAVTWWALPGDLLFPQRSSLFSFALCVPAMLLWWRVLGCEPGKSRPVLLACGLFMGLVPLCQAHAFLAMAAFMAAQMLVHRRSIRDVLLTVLYLAGSTAFVAAGPLLFYARMKSSDKNLNLRIESLFGDTFSKAPGEFFRATGVLGVLTMLAPRACFCLFVCFVCLFVCLFVFLELIAFSMFQPHTNTHTRSDHVKPAAAALLLWPPGNPSDLQQPHCDPLEAGQSEAGLSVARRRRRDGLRRPAAHLGAAADPVARAPRLRAHARRTLPPVGRAQRVQGVCAPRQGHGGVRDQVWRMGQGQVRWPWCF